MVKLEQVVEDGWTAEVQPSHFGTMHLSPPPYPTDNFPLGGIDDALFGLGRVFPSAPLPGMLSTHGTDEMHRGAYTNVGGTTPQWSPSALSAPSTTELEYYQLALGGYETSDATHSSDSFTPSPEPSFDCQSADVPLQPDTMGVDLTVDDVRSLASMCDLLPSGCPDEFKLDDPLDSATTCQMTSTAETWPTTGGSAPAPKLDALADPFDGRSAAVIAAAAAAQASAVAAPGEQRKFWCPFPGCKMRLSRPSHLEKHVRTHTNERPHKCPTCDMAFKTKWTLKKHLRIHSGERPYTCDFPGCGKSFTQRGTYRRHQRLHSADASVFKCHCGKTFKQRSNYNMHRQSHSATREFGCTVCSKAFKSARSLEKHQLLHVTKTADGRKVDLQKLYCRYCAKAFHYVGQPDGSISAADRRHFEAHEAAHTASRIITPGVPTLDLSVPDAVASAAYNTQATSTGSVKQEPAAAQFVLELC